MACDPFEDVANAPTAASKGSSPRSCATSCSRMSGIDGESTGEGRHARGRSPVAASPSACGTRRARGSPFVGCARTSAQVRGAARRAARDSHPRRSREDAPARLRQFALVLLQHVHVVVVLAPAEGELQLRREASPHSVLVQLAQVELVAAARAHMGVPPRLELLRNPVALRP